jgi:tripeptide aminopeptidase
MTELPEVAARFLRYVRIDTTADPGSTVVPSSEGQRRLGLLLADELEAMGAPGATLDDNGYLYLSLSGSPRYSGPRIGLLAHLDTSPDAPGNGVTPIVHPPYQGGRIDLPGGVSLDPSERPALNAHLGQRVITSDGTTLLGSDDKAGVAILMQLVHDLLRHDLIRPDLVICFTVDEEIGRGVDHLDVDRMGAAAAYTIDGSGIDTIQVETFNAASITFEIRGVGVHPGYAKDIMVNALHAAAALITRIPIDERPETTTGRDGFFHVHTLDAGDVSHSRMRWIVRDFDADGLHHRINAVHHWVADVKRELAGIEIEIDVRHEYANMRDAIVSTDPRVVSMAYEAAGRIGITLSEIPVRGGTDGARLSAMGIPTPNVFNGGCDYHSVYEWNTVENLERSLAFVKALVQSWADHSSDPSAEDGQTT